MVETLADAIGLRTFHLGPGVVDVLNREIEPELVTIMGAVKLGAAIGQDPVDTQTVLVEEPDHPIIENVGRRQRRLRPANRQV